MVSDVSLRFSGLEKDGGKENSLFVKAIAIAKRWEQSNGIHGRTDKLREQVHTVHRYSAAKRNEASTRVQYG